MAYEKRMCVMKQLKRGFSPDGSALSGAVYAEKWGEKLTVTPRLVGLAPLKEGRYILAVRAENLTACFELRGNEPISADFPASLREGFSALLCYVRGEAEGVAFGACGTPFRPEQLLSSVTESKEPSRSVPSEPALSSEEGSAEPREEGERGEASPFRYDDEAIAADDYYDHGDGAGGDPPQAQEETGGGDPSEDAPAPLFPRGSLTYYYEVREKLKEAFEKFPADDTLKGVFPQSEWVKTPAALLGTVYENGLPRYLCVAVERDGDPPADMAGKCCFVPLFPDGESGYYIVFHDADTGEVVLISQL